MRGLPVVGACGLADGDCMDLPDRAVDVVLPLLQGRMGIEWGDQDQRPLVANAHSLAVAPVGQHGL